MQYDEAYRRLPTLDRILDTTMREAVQQLSADAPAYFWTRPGSYDGYHNAFEHGLWVHTLRLSTVIDQIAPSLLERDMCTPRDIDRAHAAAILHDQRKNGAIDDADETLYDHDRLMAEVVANTDGLDAMVADAVASHMGGWGAGPEPQSAVDRLVHMADMLASVPAIAVPVYEPLPRELRDTVRVIEPPSYREDNAAD